MPTTEELVKIVWDFNNNQDPITKSDYILVLGSNELFMAQLGAELLL